MKGDSVLNDTYLLNALEEYMYGEKREWDEDYYKSVSIHESGHAYVCSLSGEHPSFVTIVSRGNYGGYMQHENQEKNPAYTRDQLIWQIRTSLAGRAAELEFFGEVGINTGISSDLSHATRTALNYICRFAMADAHMLSLSPEQVLNTKRGEQILEQAEKMLEEEMEKTKLLVHEGREKIQALAEFLQKNNQATEDQIADLLGFPRKAR
jgi:ATP-dependent Zn protease